MQFGRLQARPKRQGVGFEEIWCRTGAGAGAGAGVGAGVEG
jgi:hypothetical protein